MTKETKAFDEGNATIDQMIRDLTAAKNRYTDQLGTDLTRGDPMFTEPTPPKAQITWVEQRRIIRAALSVLHPAISEIRPDPADAATLLDHLESVIADSIVDTYATDAVPRLFHDMAQAAIAELLAVSADRRAPFS